MIEELIEEVTPAPSRRWTKVGPSALPSHSSHSSHSEQIISQLTEVVNSNDLYDIAESALNQIENPVDLAKCAELAARREPGGAYYRAKLWAKAEEIRSALDSGYSRLTLGLMCVEVQVGYNAAKAYITQGKIIGTAEAECREAQKSGRAYVDIAGLREISPTILQNALAQKDRGAEYLLEAVTVLEDEPRATAVQIHNRWCQDNGSIKANLDIVKPSDWWAFSHPKWRKEEDFPGSIPGEVYANALYYFAPQTGVAVDSMAGSGMLKRVYEDRDRWQKDSNFDLDIRLLDLHPSRSFIEKHDARDPLPFKADWIFIDPPYFGQSEHLFQGDLATVKEYQEYLDLLKQVIIASSNSLNLGGRFCLFLPKWSGERLSDPNYDIPIDAYQVAVESNLHWIDTAYVSRARQQEFGSAIKNNLAKRHRRMRSDTCVLNVFEKLEVSSV